jgi:hypothetical protein
MQPQPLPFLFVHIPKTGGMSIRKLLIEKFGYQVKTYNSEAGPDLHDTLFQLESLNPTSPETFVFAVCRNPYRRAYSYYSYFLKEGNLPECTFEQYLRDIDSTPLNKFRQDHFMQGRWLITQHAYPKRYVYRFENLSEFETQFGCVLPHENASDFGVQRYLEAYTPDSKKLVENIYWEDFITFGYPLEWEASLPSIIAEECEAFRLVAQPPNTQSKHPPAKGKTSISKDLS